MKKSLLFTLVWLVGCGGGSSSPFEISQEVGVLYVLAQGTEVYERPSLEAFSDFTPAAGTIVIPIQTQDSWTQVMHEDFVGWIYQSQLQAIAQIQEGYGLVYRLGSLYNAPGETSGRAARLAPGETVTISGTFTEQETLWYYGENHLGRKGFIDSRIVRLIEEDLYQDYRDALTYNNMEGLYSLYEENETIEWIEGRCQEEPYHLLSSWKHPGEISQIAFSPRGDLVLLVSQPGGVYAYNVYTQDLFQIWETSRPIARILFSPDGPIAKDLNRWEDKIYGWYNARRSLWNEITELGYFDDYVVLGNSDSSLRVYDKGLEEVKYEWRQGGRISVVDISRDFVISGNEEGEIFIYDLGTGTEARKWVLEGAIKKVRLLDDSREVLAWTHEGVFLLDVTNGRIIREWSEQFWFKDVVFSEGRGYIGAIGGKEGREVFLYDVDIPSEIGFWEYESAVTAIALEGEYLMIGTESELEMYDLETATSREFLEYEEGVVAIAFSPDGRYMLTGSKDTFGRLYVKPPFCL